MYLTALWRLYLTIPAGAPLFPEGSGGRRLPRAISYRIRTIEREVLWFIDGLSVDPSEKRSRIRTGVELFLSAPVAL